MLVCVWVALYRVLSSFFDHYIHKVQLVMLVGIWVGLYWVLFYFFDHYIQSSVFGLDFIGYYLLSLFILSEQPTLI